MTQLPSLEEMTPHEWLAAMHALREEVVDDAASVLDVRTRPFDAAPALQRIFDRYQQLDVGMQLAEEIPDGDVAVDVRYKEDMLVFWVFPTEEYKSLVYTRHDYWWFDHTGEGRRTRRRHEIHRDAIDEVLDLLPWANDDDLLEMAAIEMGSRAGE